MGATASLQQDPQLQRRLQQDSIEIAGKTIYLNPFLYWRRFDANTDRWLREPGQMEEEQILKNRLRFYPEVVWDGLSEEERAIKAGAVEMFLKSLELISTFNPELTAGQLLELERKMAVTKKRAFERWVAKSLKRRSQAQRAEKRRFSRDRWLKEWQEWSLDPVTRNALLPISGLVLLAGLGGWFMGAQQFCRPLILQPGVQQLR
ncbi:hypothetical protein [Synechococcus lacustris]|uniref:Uncharacterized protein n=1 Tax=Synechococcus lacustris str. Tous TaxID=1910958 RepID=A0A2P7EH46_9SYNE|nr:hypothetical protein [Synechococcus lacustris]MCP9794171.1 hypothetical protein [Synechococcus lacustris L1F-Slac]MCP9810983.1 hypothetical protein [Synechococcus lacustris Maggiore-St4-Slac]MCP9922012.1 hypothetical protein [Synechococcus lacustris Cruz CV12-2]MCP9924251.1 hypothetical protein [Synechococcus lacustris C3-12m-Tous]NBV69257.1 hypothetical protein [Synechococcaceae bacterium WB4_2_0805]HBU26192.1 hypothetical protein [Synechococcales bacterium UBA8138]